MNEFIARLAEILLKVGNPYALLLSILLLFGFFIVTLARKPPNKNVRIALWMVFSLYFLALLCAAPAVGFLIIGDLNAKSVNDQVRQENSILRAPLSLTVRQNASIGSPQVSPQLSRRLTTLSESSAFYVRANLTSFSPVISYAGRLAYYHGDLGKAQSLFKMARDLNPNAATHGDLGVALARQESYEAAIREFEEALEVGGDSYEAHNNLGLAYLEFALTRSGSERSPLLDLSHAEFDKALASCTRTAGCTDPAEADILYNMGILAEEQGQIDTAVTRYRRALELNPQHSDAYNNLAFLYAEDERIRNPEQAVRLATKAVELAPGSVAFQDTLARAYLASGDCSRALAEGQRAMSLARGSEKERVEEFLEQARKCGPR